MPPTIPSIVRRGRSARSSSDVLGAEFRLEIIPSEDLNQTNNEDSQIIMQSVENDLRNFVEGLALSSRAKEVEGIYILEFLAIKSK